MRVETRTEAVLTLEKANEELHALSLSTTREIESLARAFEGLAGHTDTILNLAGAIVGCVENKSVNCVLPEVQALGATARRFIADRLQATAGILETVTAEVELLRQLSRVTRGQEGIALETKALSVLTNIEVARLGAVGAGFQYLARELTEFSKSVAEDTQKLAGHTDGRRVAIEETKLVLATDLPRLREELGRVDADLGNTLAVVDSSLTQLARTPAKFRTSVEDVAQQIAGVVAAIQGHDITRQQIEHVQDGFTIISNKMRGDGNSGNEVIQKLACARAGLTIQIYQLRAIKQTVADWASQIRTCISGILRVSASEVVGIGPLVLDQERQLSHHFAHIAVLERASQAYSERIQRTLGGLSSLVQLVSEHLQRSKSVRDHLQLLTFNSIIEANRLGGQAAAILAIAKSIKGISADWSQTTDRSGHVLEEILKLVMQTNEVMEAFSEATNERLHAAQAQTSSGLESLRNAADFAARQAQEMEASTVHMQAKATEVGNTVATLDTCFSRIDAVLTEIESVLRQLELDHPEVKEWHDAAEIEPLFSASYTTEMERDVMRAALCGANLPVTQQSFAGNEVELF